MARTADTHSAATAPVAELVAILTTRYRTAKDEAARAMSAADEAYRQYHALELSGDDLVAVQTKAEEACDDVDDARHHMQGARAVILADVAAKRAILEACAERHTNATADYATREAGTAERLNDAGFSLDLATNDLAAVEALAAEIDTLLGNGTVAVTV